MLNNSIKLVSNYKFFKKLPFIELRNTYIFFLVFNRFFNEWVEDKLSKIKTSTFVVGIKKKTITIFKAPMSHKKFSKEQICIKNYLIINSKKNILVSKRVSNKVAFRFIKNMFSIYQNFYNNLALLSSCRVSYKFLHKLNVNKILK